MRYFTLERFGCVPNFFLLTRRDEMSRFSSSTTTSRKKPVGKKSLAKGRKSSGEVKDRLYRAAKKLFAEKGFRATTTAEIVEKAKTSESQLIKYFGSKEDLFFAFFKNFWEEINKKIKGLEEDISVIKKFEEIFSIVINFFEEDKELAAILLLEGRGRSEKELGTRGFLALANFFRFIGILHELFKEGQRRGELKTNLNVKASCSAIVGAGEGLLRDRFMFHFFGKYYPAGYSIDEMKAVFREVLNSFRS